MARLGIVLVISAVVTSMGIAMVFFTQYQPNVMDAGPGEQVTVGPARYTLTYEGVAEGSPETGSNRTFIMVGILAEDLQGAPASAEKRQFTLRDQNGVHTKATHGLFSETSPQITAYFPLEGDTLDSEFEYTVIVRPTKEQGSMDLAVVCVTNCQNHTLSE